MLIDLNRDIAGQVSAAVADGDLVATDPDAMLLGLQLAHRASPDAELFVAVSGAALQGRGVLA